MMEQQSASITAANQGLCERSRDAAAWRVEDDPVARRWHVAKRIVWMLTLAGAFLFYYLTDKLHEALSLLR
jgi:hypothetical protein